MSGQDPPGAPFEEQAALEELERLQRAIQESQRRRRQATDAFDTFVQSFSTRSEAPAPESAPPSIEQPIKPQSEVVADVSLPAPTDPDPIEPQSRDEQASRLPGWQGLVSYPRERPEQSGLVPAPEPLLAAEQESPLPADESIGSGTGHVVPPAAPINERQVPAALLQPRPKRRGGAIGVGVALVAVIAIVTWRVWPTGDTPAPDVSSSPAVTAPAQAAAAAPVEARVPRAELITLRRVWVRVLIDGNPAPAIERELDANTRIPLDADERIVVRAGDAGSVRVSIGGKDQGALGVEGQPVTKAFTPPTRR